MSLFALLRSDGGGDPQIQDCHLNLWSLGGFPGRRPTLFDVGLRIKSGGDVPVSAFQIVIPFGTHSASLVDLEDKLRNELIANLIFSGRATLVVGPNGATIDYGAGTVAIGRLDIARSKLLAEASDTSMSLWEVKLSAALPRDASTYVRMRFNIDTLGRTWLWRSSMLARNGALVDFRIGDARNVRWASQRIASNRMLEIGNLFLFVVAPAWLQLQTSHPSLHYIRLLEGRPWWSYLDGATDLLREGKLVIYQWRAQGVGTEQKTLHAFLDLGRHSPLITLGELLRVLLLLMVLSTSIGLLAWNASYLVGLTLKVWAGIGFAGFLALLLNIYKDRKTIREIRAWTRRALQWIDRKVLRIRAAM